MKTSSVLLAPAAPAELRGLLAVPRWLRVLHQRHPLLAWAGWLHIAVLAVALLLWPLDSRTVTGLNVWIKPAKFGMAGAVYLWTLAWLLSDLPAAGQRGARRIGRLVAVSMAAEIGCITMQAARGTTSHFNIGSAFDMWVFNAMGLMILLNTIAIIWALVLIWRQRPAGSAAWVWGIRLGLLIFLVGSAVGGAMSGQMAHTVGAADGGPGLPVLGWSTRHGDLRAAHFLGLHALQALPLAGWLLTRYAPRLRPTAQTAILLAFGLVYAGAVGWLYWHAMQGLPLWAAR